MAARGAGDLAAEGVLPAEHFVGEPDFAVAADVHAGREAAFADHAEQRRPAHRDQGQHLLQCHHRARFGHVSLPIACANRLPTSVMFAYLVCGSCQYWSTAPLSKSSSSLWSRPGTVIRTW